MSNAQVAALGCQWWWAVLIAVARAKNVQWAPELAGSPRS